MCRPPPWRRGQLCWIYYTGTDDAVTEFVAAIADIVEEGRAEGCRRGGNNAPNSAVAVRGRTFGTYWSGRTITTAQRQSRPRKSKMSADAPVG